MTEGTAGDVSEDTANALAALVRASKRARLLAAQTQTEFVVVREGKLVREIPTLESCEVESKNE